MNPQIEHIFLFFEKFDLTWGSIFTPLVTSSL